MKSWKIIAIILTVVAIAGVAFTATAYGMMSGQSYLGMYGTNNANINGYSGGMMNGYGNGNMMGGYGYSGMMNGYANNLQGTDCGNHNQITNGNNPISITAAQTNAQNYVDSLNNPDLSITQVEEYSNNFYVQVTEKSTNNGAFEVLVDKYTGEVFPEMGPNMMWNIKYATQTGGMMSGGMMGTGGMMSGYSNTITPTTTLPVDLSQAKVDAEQYLNVNYPATTTGDVTTFYGYYTIEVLNGTTTQGMLSVNGYTGQVWYHTWHGNFVQELQVS